MSFLARFFAGLSILLLAAVSAHAQQPPSQIKPVDKQERSAFVRFFTDAEWYVSFGYSKQYWAPTDIHVSQPSLGNDFTVHGATGHDEPASPFSADFLGPQYNIRVGRFINPDRTIAIEVSLDHSKYTLTSGQMAQITGTIGGAPVNANFKLDDNTFKYLLHNGANHLMVNAVYRYPLIGKINEQFSLAFIGKGGLGIMVPHVDNTVFGNPNNVGSKTFSNFFGIDHGWWQFGGWTAGVEAGLRFVVYGPLYVELTDKLAYSQLWKLPVYQGTAAHSLLMNEIVFSLGYTFNGTPTRH